MPLSDRVALNAPERRPLSGEAGFGRAKAWSPVCHRRNLMTKLSELWPTMRIWLGAPDPSDHRGRKADRPFEADEQERARRVLIETLREQRCWHD